jgi:hypothetical protein
MLDISEAHGCQPPIDEVVQAYGIELRRRGRQLFGICPFHADKNPSFAVDPEKNFWICYACNVGGDPIRFVEKYHGVDFKGAIKLLGIGGGTRPPRRPDPAREEARRIAAWAWETSKRVCAALREIGGEIYICSVARRQPGVDLDLVTRQEASCIRRWAILSDLDDDLNDPDAVLELWRQREEIDAFVERLR